MNQTLLSRRHALLIAVLGPLTSAVWAGPCDAPWMHEGGGFTLSAQSGHRDTRFTLTQFSKSNGDRCSGKLTAHTSITIGSRNISSDSVVDLAVENGKLMQGSGEVRSKVPNPNGVDALSGSMTVQASGLLSYIGLVSGPGQRLPATKTTHSVGAQMTAQGVDMGQLRALQMVSQTSERTVGAAQTLQTAAGGLSCWPISYERSSDSGNVQMPGMTRRVQSSAHIVDHYCPATGLVMRQDIDEGGVRSSVLVTEIR